MPARDRGWKAKGARETHAKLNPRGVSVSQSKRSRAVKGAVTLPRPRGLPQYRPWEQLPANWLGPKTEWEVWWYLTVHGIGPERRKLRPNIDFFYQRGLKSPGLFLNKPFTRGDFILPGLGRGLRGTVFDPITPFTHPFPWFDIRKRRILLLAGWRVIFMDAPMLDRWPGFVIELALRGIDVSSRGARWP